jgi:hypothetical protein
MQTGRSDMAMHIDLLYSSEPHCFNCPAKKIAVANRGSSPHAQVLCNIFRDTLRRGIHAAPSRREALVDIPRQ